MARHDQKPRESKYTCSKCKEIECGECIDEVRKRLFGDQTQRVCVCSHADWLAGQEAPVAANNS